jgi:NAD(P)-dependent dehydrogenase (short-subunit alcohol dehydrogenase family)
MSERESSFFAELKQPRRAERGCMTTKVAIAAQYASGISTSRAIMTDTVAATAVRTACVLEGRFFSSQADNFMRTRSLQQTCFGKIDILVNDAGVYELSPLEEIN